MAFGHLEDPSGPLDSCIGRDHWVALLPGCSPDQYNKILVWTAAWHTATQWLLGLQPGTNVKNVTKGKRGGKGKEGKGRGPAQVWGSDIFDVYFQRFF